MWVLTGMGLGVLGIALCGLAGRLKELDFRDQHGDAGEFSLAKGLPLAILAGVLSAVYGIAINDVAKPIVDIAASHGAGHWKGNIALPFVNTRGLRHRPALQPLPGPEEPLPGRVDPAASAVRNGPA